MQNIEEKSPSIEDIRSKLLIRVFINNCDTYIGHNIAEIIANAIPQATLKEATELDEVNSQIEEITDNVSSVTTDSFEIIGTLKNPLSVKPSWLCKVIESDNPDEILSAMKASDVIIYDIGEDFDALDQTLWAVTILKSEAPTFETLKLFICLSTIMTWVKTKPLDPYDRELTLSEEDFKRRIPHPNFHRQLQIEKCVMASSNKENFITYVLACGLVYGHEENIFHYLFKDAWLSKQALDCYGNGRNVIPTIHVKDLTSIVLNVIDRKPKIRYLVAVDNSNNNLKEIVKSISYYLGTGKVNYISKEDALLNESLPQNEFDKIVVNLRIEGIYIKEHMNIEWVALSGMVDNMKKMIKEFKEYRNLSKPIKICVLGPPAVGKSKISQQLTEYYHIHHITIGEVISEAVENLEQSAARSESELSEREHEQYNQDKELLEALKENKENNNNRYDDHYVHRFLRKKLKSMSCKNQGFILDGYPKTFSQAQDLFASNDENTNEDDNLDYDPEIMPDNVIWLDANDDYLRNRVLNLPEKVVRGSHSTEEGFLRRLVKFHEDNLDETVQHYFDDYAVRVDHYDLTQDPSDNSHKTIRTIIELLGAPRHYGKLANKMAKKENLRRLQMEKERKVIEEREQIKYDIWKSNKERDIAQEKEALDDRSLPIKRYLMRHVLPTLTQGLIECCRHRPDDPIDYLAEFIFKNNPEIDII
ncbi:uncharacterized protein TRIADDRAFT_18926 [Trichoplax adhaerens]|uniref:Adenylate kinase 7 n=1 Tax=Trichoplax adhaerens TaxID=10228 RepID=B3RKN7_TRIAD|nr:hypothetical protein TRIADDRAFT_18926 [Trichoplax adhaerens]EDV29925.1 hypothetical protein TRIADDRAFT_18926 [Trichoplax adhaerens]|eukprot:XP_002109127.1 hypothetical protein TRIADDRAFT_18926 [Trichoplax adhaerens]